MAEERGFATRVGIVGNAGLALALAIDAGLTPVIVGEGALSGVLRVPDLPALIESLAPPRCCLLDLPPGAALDDALDQVSRQLEPGDAVVDLSGSYWGDVLRRYRRARHRAVYYIDAASIGSLWLVSGDDAAVELVMPLLTRLARGCPVVVAGRSGASHFALMVRDGYLTAAREAASEAQQLLEAFPGGFERAARDAVLGDAPPRPAGRAAWLLDDALRLEAATPLMAQAVMLALGTALEELRSEPPPERVGGFVHPDDLA